jgi:hypothetical protein
LSPAIPFECCGAEWGILRRTGPDPCLVFALLFGQLRGRPPFEAVFCRSVCDELSLRWIVARLLLAYSLLTDHGPAHHTVPVVLSGAYALDFTVYHAPPCPHWPVHHRAPPRNCITPLPSPPLPSLVPIAGLRTAEGPSAAAAGLGAKGTMLRVW